MDLKGLIEREVLWYVRSMGVYEALQVKKNNLDNAMETETE